MQRQTMMVVVHAGLIVEDDIKRVAGHSPL